MGKIHDALQRAEQARRGAETLDVPVAPPPGAVSHTPPAAEPAPRTRGWSLRRRTKTPRAAAPPQREELVLSAGSGSPLSEEYRTLRARIQSLRRTRELRTIVVSSTRPGEGKTTTAINLALSFGLERENSICLVDADLRTPHVQQVFPAGRVGLVEVLEGDAKLDEALIAVPDTRLWVLPVKALPSAPSELLSARAMVDLLAELCTRFHTVIVDAPPVLGLPDSVTLVDLCDAALFVVGAGRSPRAEVESALTRLDANKLIGVVLNRCDRTEASYLGSYGYQKS
jgi:capsular exopolysaccharide synthesis family protein